MVNYHGLLTAKPEAWAARADDWVKVAQHCGQSAADLYLGAGQLRQHWPDRAGELHTQALADLADAYGAARTTCGDVTNTLQALADGAARAQRGLQSALDFARTNGLTVDASGRVTGPTDKGWELNETVARLSKALTEATSVDHDAEARLKSFTAQVGSPRPDPEGQPGAPTDVHMAPGEVNAVGKHLDDLAGQGQQVTRTLLAHSESGARGGYSLSTIGPINDNPDWDSLIALGFCAYRWRQHFDGLLKRISDVGSGVTASSKSYDAADQEAAGLLQTVLTHLAQ